MNALAVIIMHATVAPIGRATRPRLRLAFRRGLHAAPVRMFPQNTINRDVIITCAVTGRAANSRKGSRGSHRTPSHPVEDPLDPLQIGKLP